VDQGLLIIEVLLSHTFRHTKQ